MGAMATNYRWRKIAMASGAENDVEFYGDGWLPPGPRPCYCEWDVLQDELLGCPPRPTHACHCIGPVPFVVPGYTGRGDGDKEKMREFAQECRRSL